MQQANVVKWIVRSRPAGYTVEGKDEYGSYIESVPLVFALRSYAVAEAQRLNAEIAE